MQHHIDTVLDEFGAPISGLSVQVYDVDTTTGSTIYSDNGVTSKTNPLTTDANGQFDFYAANGRYDLVISGTGFTTKTLPDIRLEEQLDEASGTATILDTTTAISVTHGLTGTPTIDEIFVTMGENPTNDPGNVWVDGITSTVFVINCRNDPGASNLDFGWYARVR